MTLMGATVTMPLQRHAQACCDIAASRTAVFEYVDRPERLSAHMA